MENKEKIFNYSLNFSICKSCKFVHQTNSYTKPYFCPNCGDSIKRQAYFTESVNNMVFLIDCYSSSNRIGIIKVSEQPRHIESIYHLAVVVFFWTLVEVLLSNFLRECMEKMQIPQTLQEKIFKDNLSIKKKINELFQTVTCVKWNEAINNIDKQSKFNYLEIARFCEKINSARNKFLHEGIIWAVEDDDPEKCYNNTKPLLSLFVDLHNQYISNTNYKP